MKVTVFTKEELQEITQEIFKVNQKIVNHMSPEMHRLMRNNQEITYDNVRDWIEELQEIRVHMSKMSELLHAGD